jgi:hypothetical protein
MSSRLLLTVPVIFLCGCSSAPVETSDAGPVAVSSLTAPPLAQAFPLAPQNDGMRVSFPVLVNETTIVTPAAVLRFVYTKSSSDQAGRVPHKSTTEQEADDQALSTQVRHRHSGGAGDAPPTSSGGFPNGQVAPLPDDPNAPPVDKNAKGNYAGQEMAGTVWVDQFLYTEALANAVENRTIIVYSIPPTAKTISAPLRLIGGMLLGETGGRVSVLALGETSPAFLVGVRAGDLVETVEGQGPVTSLTGFVSAYAKARSLAAAGGTGSVVTVNVLPQKGDRMVPVEVVPGN